MGGYIKLNRDLQNHWLWTSAVHFQWWVDLLFMAAWEDRKVMDDGHLFVLERGKMIASISFLSNKWKVSAPTVIKFLKLLEAEDMVKREVLYRQTPILTICNYDKYQGFEGNGVYTQVDSIVNTQVDSIVYTNKEIKEVKEVKNKKTSTNVDTKKSETKKKSVYAGIIKTPEEIDFENGMKEHYPTLSTLKEPLTLVQYRELSKDYSSERIKDILCDMENYVPIKKKKSVYLTARRWLKGN